MTIQENISCLHKIIISYNKQIRKLLKERSDLKKENQFLKSMLSGVSYE